MTEVQPADPVGPVDSELLLALIIMTDDVPPDDDAPQTLTASEVSDMVERIQSRLGTEPHVTNTYSAGVAPWPIFWPSRAIAC